MRDGKYWFNLMTLHEQIKWAGDSYVPRGSYRSMYTKTYDNFEEFILWTIPLFDEHTLGWIGIIDKYSDHYKLSPKKYLQPLKF
jgi:hypothetical protein